MDFCEEELSYHSQHIYTRKCRQANVLQLLHMFDKIDMIMFHQIVYRTTPLSFPEHLKPYDGTSGLRTTHLDHLSYVSNIQHNTTGINNLNISFFLRSHTLWNSLPLEIRSEENLNKFKNKLEKHLWKIALRDTDESDDDGLSSLDDSC